MTISKLLKPHKTPIILSVLLMTLAELSSPALLALSGLLIVLASTGIPIMLLTVQIVSVRAFALARASAAYGEDIITHDTAFKIVASARTELFEKLIDLVPGSIRKTDILSGIVHDIDDVRDALLAAVIPLIAIPLAAVIVFVSAFLTNIQAGLILLVSMLVAILGTVMVTRLPFVEEEGRQHLHRALGNTIEGLDELRTYNASGHAFALIDDLGQTQANTEKSLAIRRGLAVFSANFVGGICTATLALNLFYQTKDGVNPLLVAPLVLMSLGSFEMISALGIGVQRIRVAKKALSRLNKTIAVEPIGYRDNPTVQAFTSIRIRNLSVPYTSISDLNFDVRKGDVVAISGRSGIGKTTLIRVLSGMIKAPHGYLYAGKEKINHLRENLAIASQDAHLLPTTIRSNIAIGFGDGVANSAELNAKIEAAVDKAQLSEWVDSLPQGLDTHVGVGALSVSGGQQRRIALARALVSDRPFVVLDEPTAGLDGDTANRFLEDAFSALKGKGIILISHEQEVLDRADRTLNLEEYSQIP